MSKRIIASEHGRGKRTREAEIVRASAIGIAANFLLAAFKAIVGHAVNSVAMKLDAVNNLSDALSAVLTIAGTKLAVKKPDKRHPFGYGRVEYLTSLSIGVLVLYAGINSMVASVRHILRPEAPDHSAASLIVTAVAIVGKLALGAYARRVGKRVGSTALLDSATDALLDALLSASVLISALLTLLAGLNLDGWVGAVLSIFIMRAGVGMLQVHGFFIDAEQRRAGFDLVLDYGLPDRQAVCEAVGAEVRAAFPDYDIRITQDIDV